MSENLLPVLTTGVNKRQIEEMAIRAIETYQDGENYGSDKILQLAENVSVVELFLEKLKSNSVFRDLVREQLAKHSNVFNAAGGAVIETLEAGVKYDYSRDATWRQLNNELEKAKNAVKLREKWLLAIPDGQSIADPETGEQCFRPTKTSISTFKVSLPK